LTKRDPSLKFCFFTAYEVNREQFKKEFPEIKFECFLKKPMSIARLAEEINRLLENNPASDFIQQPSQSLKGPNEKASQIYESELPIYNIRRRTIISQIGFELAHYEVQKQH
jgi:hypothetical protein